MTDEKSDVAGAMIGWSIGTGVGQKRLDELLEFPCAYDFKAVGVGEEQFVEDMLARVAVELGRAVEPHEYSVKMSKEGRYASVTLRLDVNDADQIYRIYSAIQRDQRVKYIL